MRSDRTQLWLLAFLALFFMTSQADKSPLKVMSAPNLLRVGTVENIFVECQDCSGDEKCTVEIVVLSHPTKARKLTSTTVTLTKKTKFQDFGQIKILPDKLSEEYSNIKHYVYLQARFSDVELEKVVLLSFQSGYIFIQTDKTIYTPNTDVFYRMFAVKPNMEPVDSDSINNTSIITEIVTPNGITLPLYPSSLQSGIRSGIHKLGEIVSFGLWKITARFHNNLQQSFSAEFEVKEYVLPSFEVKLKPEKPYFHVDSNELTIYITATYLFGKQVSGVAYAVFGIVTDSDKKSFPGSLQRVLIKEGNGEVTLKKEHITQIPQNILELVGSSIYVSVSVLTENGGEMVEAELRSIQIVTSPYTINFKKTPRYFKPGMSFDVTIEVTHPDGTPAQGISVEVEPGEPSGVTKANGMARLSINTELNLERLIITAKTNVPGITQASATMTALPYTTKKGNYIHIGVDSDDIKIGDNLKINLNLNNPENSQHDVTYLILSRGQLVKHGRQGLRPLITVIVTVDKDMVPSFRIIAYYHTNDSEVVSDSIWVPVKGSCMGSLKLESSITAPSYEPGKMFGLRITGDPGATVGLVAVDKGVYILNNKHRLTQKKIWDIVAKYDTGCTPGGGKDAMSVFYDAGLLFESNVASGSPYRQELKCPSPSRRKRATTIFDVKTSLVSQYKEKKQRDCCLSGMRATPLSYNCERRSEYIMDGAACVEAFLHCCKELESQQAEMKHDSLLLARSEEEDSYMDSNEIISRTKFPESWLWTNIKLPACSTRTPNCATTFYKYPNTPLKDSITTWQFIGISLSRTHSICVADPLEVIVRKPFFIDLRLPYSAVRGEQLEIKAILHNYSPDPVTVRVDLIEVKDVCSSASRRGKYRQEVGVGSGSSRSLPFIIIPMKEGPVQIEVKAVVKDSFLFDGIKKTLLVVPEGIQTKSLKIITLDPAKKGVDGEQEEILNSEIPETDIVPNTRAITQISVTGREQLSALVENAISGKSMGTLIKQPSGCGEQNMISMTLPVIATIYLDKTNQWEVVGFEKRKEALEHIKLGYENELVYRKIDGSFSVFTHHDSSTWLTAYVAKVFAMAYDLVGVKKDVICDAVKFLISTQQPNGTFKEVGTIIHGEMIGDVRGKDSDASMTAFCLSAMQESRRICNKTVEGLQHSIDKAVTYLEKHLHNLTNPYAAAITSYALANEEKLQRQILSKFIFQELTHWPVRETHLFTLEATAYALLALVKVKAFEDARPVVRWFNKQQIDGGGYGSTQATIMVYQAIAEYWVSAKESEYDVNVDIVFLERKISYKYNFQRADHYTTRTSKINGINKNVKVIARGTGEATVKMVSLYYALPKEKESDCQKFNLSVQLIPVKMDEDEKIYKLKIDVLYKDNNRDATMAILDIGLLTGFTVNTDDLNLLSKGCARVISRYEMDKALSERGSLIIYLDKVSHSQPEEIAFRIHQTLKVGVLQPAAVSVYEYYDHQQNNERHCIKFYHPERRNGELLRLCRSNECTCAEENCSMQKKEKINNEDRTYKACETELNSRIDYVYKVRVENFTAHLSTDIYTMRVVTVIKEGSYDACQLVIGEDAKIEKNCDVAPEGKLRTFLSYPHCRVALNLDMGKTYLIMGLASDISQDTKSQSYQYVLGERTWIEYWPTEAECQDENHRHTCLGMEDLVSQLTIFGCLQK